jgi:hypothetical protein
MVRQTQDLGVTPAQVYRSMDHQLHRERAKDPLQVLKEAQANMGSTAWKTAKRLFTDSSAAHDHYKALPPNSFYADSRYYFKPTKEVLGLSSIPSGSSHLTHPSARQGSLDPSHLHSAPPLCTPPPPPQMTARPCHLHVDHAAL